MDERQVAERIRAAGADPLTVRASALDGGWHWFLADRALVMVRDRDGETRIFPFARLGGVAVEGDKVVALGLRGEPQGEMDCRCTSKGDVLALLEELGRVLRIQHFRPQSADSEYDRTVTDARRQIYGTVYKV